jgi:23S rRNA pseudouridine1911/1915/1917 synthase
MAEEYFTAHFSRKHQDLRLDAALHSLLSKDPSYENISRNSLSEAIRTKQVLLNGHMPKASTKVSAGDHVSFSHHTFKSVTPSLSTDDNLSIPIIFENRHFIIIDKPAGIAVHPASSLTIPTVAHWIAAHFPKILSVGENPLRPGIVHRLDKDTSGLMVIAKTIESYDALKKLFHERSIIKRYLALVYGNLISSEGSIDLPLARSFKTLKRTASERSSIGIRRSALTFYRLLRRYEDADLLELSPKTGRTHQLRVHLAHIDHPIIGDALYAGSKLLKQHAITSSRHLLHAFSLEFELLGKKYSFISPLPADFRSVLESIDETKITGYDGEALESLLQDMSKE